MAKVSIIIPVYNAAPYLNRCVDSVLAQTLDDLEIILVDDGSTDGSAALCDAYAGRGAVVLHRNHQGLSAARNAGMDVAVGEYIAFLDSDDYIDPRMYDEMYSVGRREGIDIVCCDYAQVKNGVVSRGAGPYLPAGRIIGQEEIRRLLITEQSRSVLWFVWKSLFRRRFLADHGIRFLEEKIIEDTPFNLEALLCAKCVWCIDKAFYYYVQTPDSLMRAKYKPDFCDQINNCYLARKRISEKYHLEGFEKALYAYQMTHSIVLLLSNEMNHHCSFREKREVYRQIRECPMVSDTFRNAGVRLIRSRIRVPVIMLKYRLYDALAVITL